MAGSKLLAALWLSHSFAKNTITSSNTNDYKK